jgi:hypothetical protein
MMYDKSCGEGTWVLPLRIIATSLHSIRPYRQTIWYLKKVCFLYIGKFANFAYKRGLRGASREKAVGVIGTTF